MFLYCTATLVALCPAVSNVIALDGRLDQLILKNNSPYEAYIYVNHKYQGYIKPEEGANCLSAGSFHPEHPTVLGDPFRGGWGRPLWSRDHVTEKDNQVEVTVCLQQGQSLLSTTLTVTGDQHGNGYIWFGDQSQGGEPDWKQISTPQINYSDSTGTPPLYENIVSNGPVFAKTRQPALDPNLLATVNTKFRAGDYQGALADLKKAETNAVPNSETAQLIKKMISELNDFLNRRH